MTRICRARLAALLSLFFALPLLAACATAPATGKRIFTGGMTLAVEAEVGRDLHGALERLPGGLYEEPGLLDYVRAVGARIEAVADAPHALRFAVLDQSRIYAGAVPGGYIYISRGLLSLLWDEAEVAAVLAHEAGHISARHGAERMGHFVLHGESSPRTARYLREQEEEADRLALDYLERAGYPPAALVRALTRIGRSEALLADVLSNPALIAADALDDHPLTGDRVRALRAKIGLAERGTDTPAERRAFLAVLEDLPFGASPQEGFFVGERYVRPAEGIALELAPGWGSELEPGILFAARGPGALVRLDAVKAIKGRPLPQYLRQDWPGNLGLRSKVETTRINGIEAAFAEIRRPASAEGEPDSLALYAVLRLDGNLHRFFAIVPDREADRAEVWGMLKSFDRARQEELVLEAPRLRAHRVAEGETVAELAAAIPIPGTPRPGLKERIFRLLNDLPDRGEPEPGRLVKLVAAP